MGQIVDDSAWTKKGRKRNQIDTLNRIGSRPVFSGNECKSCRSTRSSITSRKWMSNNKNKREGLLLEGTMFFSIIFLLFCTTTITNLDAFNLEPKLPILKRGEISSYFGFSVAQHSSKDGNPWILVGAPLGQNLQPETNRSGALFKCPLTGFESDCSQVITDGKRDRDGFYDPMIESSSLYPPSSDEIKDGQWLGVNVRSQGPGGKVVVCAHRYVHSGVDFRWSLGLCHFLSQSLDYDQTLLPCMNKQRRGLEDYGYCQAGTSVHLLPEDTALIGVPGAFTCRGAVYGISVSSDYLAKDPNRYHSPLLENNPLDKYSYLGMSVRGDAFLHPTQWSYAAGAPKAALGSGQVLFFSKGSQEELRIEATITGEGFAFGFGYELTSLDLNGDKRPDLIVGAPFYTNVKNAGGAVYVYLNGDGERDFGPASKFTRLVGPSHSRFGQAISTLGDLNKDGYEDLAVGAPYADEGSGSVYIYLGSKNGVIREASQIISASEYFPTLKTFGHSLSGGLDLDKNTYPDLAVGAFESDMVVLLRSRPIIDISTEVKGNLTNIDPSSKGCASDLYSEFVCFEFEACFEIRENTSLQIRSASLGIQYRIEAETFVEGKKFSRVTFRDGEEDKPQLVKHTKTLKRNELSEKQCSQEVVYLKDSTKDIQSPIAFKLTYTLIQREPKYIPNSSLLPKIENYPILNQQEASKVFYASFEKDCGGNEICESDLFVQASPVDLETDESQKDPGYYYLIVLGKEPELVLNITVANFDEPAYEAMLFISHPKSMPYIGRVAEGADFGCTPYNASLVVCPLGNPYKSKGKDLESAAETIRLRFDAVNLQDIESRLDFRIWANSTSLESENGNNDVNLVATVVKIAELILSGRGEPEKVFYGGSVIGEAGIKTLSEIGPRVIHQYEIWNEGPWKASSFMVDIWWPHQVENGKAQGKWLLYPEAHPALDGDGSCFLPPDVIDPIHLGNRALSQQIQPSQEHLRSKRETERIVLTQKERDPDGKTKTFVEMNCVRGSAKCFKIECIIRNLLPRESAVIKISSRLWNGTLVEDYPSVDEVRVRSRAKIRMTEETNRQDPGNDESSAGTTCYPDLKLKVEFEGVPWWIYAAAAAAGLLILALIVYCLHKSGFFKRRRPQPPTHTASVVKP